MNTPTVLSTGAQREGGMSSFREIDDSEIRELESYRDRRASVSWRLRSPLRRAEHLLRRLVADRRQGSRPVSALKLALPRVTITGRRELIDTRDRIAIVASYSNGPEVSRSLVGLVDEFERNGYSVVLVHASDSPTSLDWPEQVLAPSVIIAKPNVGYDFGSWATALAVLPRIASKNFVILANDSLLGPFTPLAPMIDDFERSPTDVWGATDTIEYIPHLQSYLLGFKGGVLSHASLRSFWRTIRIVDDKDLIVVRYEIGLSRLLATEGFRVRAWFEHSRIVPEGGNPTTVGGSRLVQAGFPFVKRILMENPHVFPDAAVARTTVLKRYGLDVLDWL